jgi:hypothetical protein
MSEKQSARSMNDDERHVLDRLEGWADRINQLIRLYDRNGAMPARHVDGARDVYRSIKADLKADYQRGATDRGRAELSPAELRWFQRTVHQASAHRFAPTNHPPEKWLAGLGSARSDFQLAISKMKSAFSIED